MVSELVDKIGREGMQKERSTDFGIGDGVRVFARIKEGDKERIQAFSGVVIARNGGGAGEMFTVRRVSHGVGVEKVFPVHSPYIDRIEVQRRGRVRRAKLYYLRNIRGTKMKVKGVGRK
ncbi:MAG: 50S ribosomal protein L19 [Kiritimatiellia bacterium]